MRKGLWAIFAAMSLVVAGGAVLVSAQRGDTQASSFTCPVTGEELSCPKCCPF